LTIAPVPVPDSTTAAARASAPRRSRLRRILKWLAAGFAAILVLPWLWIQLFTPAPGPVAMPEIPDDMTVPVYVMAFDHHTSIFIEQRPEWRLGPVGNEEARFVEIGWGHGTWYMEGRQGAVRALSAAFLPNASVVYVAGYPLPPHENFSVTEVYVREFRGDELRRLVNTLEQAIIRQDDGTRSAAYPPVETHPGRFYPGREYYIFWHSCNHWTVEQLRKSGQDISERGVCTSGQALARLEGWRKLR
jgi:hypothetical protein